MIVFIAVATGGYAALGTGCVLLQCLSQLSFVSIRVEYQLRLR